MPDVPLRLCIVLDAVKLTEMLSMGNELQTDLVRQAVSNLRTLANTLREYEGFSKSPEDPLENQLDAILGYCKLLDEARLSFRRN